MNTEERKLADVLHRITPEPPRRVTVEQVAYRLVSEPKLGRQTRGRESAGPRPRGRGPLFSRALAPVLAAAAVVVIAGMIDATTPEPIVARAINASFWQTVSTPDVAGATYTLDVDLGFAKPAPDEASVFLEVGGHQVLATPFASYGLNQGQMRFTGNWYDFQASYTATSADAGDPIEILLSSMTNGNGYGFFADVRLAWDAPPPPVVHPNNRPVVAEQSCVERQRDRRA